MSERVRVLCFGPLRAAAGRGEFSFDLESPSVAAAWAALLEAAPGVSAITTGVRVAVNRTYAAWDTRVRAGDEVAFIPPVAGG